MRSSLFCAYFSRFSSEVCYYNLSPQGDGNVFCACAGLSGSQITTYPRKGTETLVSCLSPPAPAMPITTYPRKGTETGADFLKKLNIIDYNLSPQGDGNPTMTVPWPILVADYNLSPQGDGNIIGVVNLASGESLQLIPARGRKLREQFEEVTDTSDYTFSPQGDGNCNWLSGWAGRR